MNRSISLWTRPYSLIRIKVLPRESGSHLTVTLFAPAFLIIPVVLAAMWLFQTEHFNRQLWGFAFLVYFILWCFYEIEKRSVIKDLEALASFIRPPARTPRRK